MGWSQSSQGWWAEERNQGKAWPFQSRGLGSTEHAGAGSCWGVASGFGRGLLQGDQEGSGSPKPGPPRRAKKTTGRLTREVTQEYLRATSSLWDLLVKGKAEHNRPRYREQEGNARHGEGLCVLGEKPAGIPAIRWGCPQQVLGPWLGAAPSEMSLRITTAACWSLLKYVNRVFHKSLETMILSQRFPSPWVILPALPGKAILRPGREGAGRREGKESRAPSAGQTQP